MHFRIRKRSTITGPWDATTGVMKLNGVDTVNYYQAEVRGVYYVDMNTNPDRHAQGIIRLRGSAQQSASERDPNRVAF